MPHKPPLPAVKTNKRINNGTVGPPVYRPMPALPVTQTKSISTNPFSKPGNLSPPVYRPMMGSQVTQAKSVSTNSFGEPANLPPPVYRPTMGPQVTQAKSVPPNSFGKPVNPPPVYRPNFSAQTSPNQVVTASGRIITTPRKAIQAWAPLKNAETAPSSSTGDDDAFQVMPILYNKRKTKDTTKGTFEITGKAIFYSTSTAAKTPDKLAADLGFKQGTAAAAGAIPSRLSAPT